MSNERYSRQIRLKEFGREAQEKLSRARVLIVGCGGLGIPCAQYLNAMGVGTLGLMDADRIEASNLHRQTLYGEDDIGKSKVMTLENKLHAQNPATDIPIYDEYLSAGNALQRISAFDLVVDATDNLGSRYLINDACVMSGKPFVYGAVNEFEGHVSVFNYNKGPTYRCLYPESPDPEVVPDCETLGVLGVLPALTGTWQAMEAVKVLTGIGQPLSGKLMIIDALDNTHYAVGLKPKPENHRIVRLKDRYPTPGCGEQVDEINAITFMEWLEKGKKMQVLDVRRVPIPDDHPAAGIARHFPLEKIGQQIDSVDPETPVILLCDRGRSSLEGSRFLKHLLPGAEIYNLKGGLHGLKGLEVEDAKKNTRL